MRILATAEYLTTDGLTRFGNKEITVREGRPDWQKDAGDLLMYVADYVSSSGNRIRAGETLNYGFWLLKFVAPQPRELEVFEYDLSGSRFIPGARLALEFWRDQHEVCLKAGSVFAPPRPDQLVAVSADLTISPEIEGVRYSLGSNKSGWIITSQGFSGPVKSLQQEHMLHIIQYRRDIIRYLALSTGYRFLSNGESRVWFDRVAATR
jgi:hypothetical protein